MKNETRVETYTVARREPGSVSERSAEEIFSIRLPLSEARTVRDQLNEPLRYVAGARYWYVRRDSV